MGPYRHVDSPLRGGGGREWGRDGEVEKGDGEEGMGEV